MIGQFKFLRQESLENFDYRDKFLIDQEIYKTEFPQWYSESAAGKALFMGKLFKQGSLINVELMKFCWENKKILKI